MVKNRFLRSFWLRFGLELLSWQATLTTLTWLLYRQVAWLQQYRFSDELLLIGVVELMISSAGLLGRTYDASPARPVEPTEATQGTQALVRFVAKRSFSLRLAASGVLTILIAVGFAYGVGM